MILDSSLKKDTIIYGLATLSERVVSFLLLPLLTKTLSQELYGIWTQMIVTISLLLNIVLIGAPSAIVKFLSGMKDRVRMSKIFHVLLTLSLINILIVIIFFYIFAPSLSILMFGNVYLYKFVYLFSFFLLVEALFELFTALIRTCRKIKLLSLYYILKHVLRVTLLAIFILVFHTDFFTAIFFVIIFQLFLIILIYIKDIFKELGLYVSFYNIDLKRILNFSLPLIPYTLMFWSNNFVDRYFILHILNIKEVSVYAVSYSFAAIIGIFYSILGFTMYPYMAKAWNEGNKRKVIRILERGFEYYFLFAFPTLIFLTILNRPLIKIFTTDAYISSAKLILWIGMGIIMLGIYQLTIYPILLMEKTLLNLKILGMAMVVNIILNALLIPHIGILGASISTFISNCILAILTIKIGRKYLPYSFNIKNLLKIGFTTIEIALLLFWITKFIDISTVSGLVWTSLWGIVFYIIMIKWNEKIITKIL